MKTRLLSIPLISGANFKLKIKKVAGYWNYDSSEFGPVEPLLPDDDALESIWKKQYSLNEITARDKFKSYEDLKKRLDMVLGMKKVSTPVWMRVWKTRVRVVDLSPQPLNPST